MAILLLGDTTDMATEIGLDLAGETGEVVVLVRDVGHFQRILNYYEGNLQIDSVLVLGINERLSVQWENFLQRYQFYRMGLPIRWMTLVH